MEEDLKKSWEDTKFEPLGEQQRAEIIAGKRRTALQQLADRYRWFSNIALPMMVLIPFVGFNNVLNLAPLGWKLAWSIFAVSYFGLCSLMDRWLYKGVSRIDCATMTVNEVSEKAMYYRKRHLQFIIVLVPMAIIMIGGLFYLTDRNEYFLYGCIVGGIIGLVIGLRQFLCFMSEYKAICQ